MLRYSLQRSHLLGRCHMFRIHQRRHLRPMFRRSLRYSHLLGRCRMFRTHQRRHLRPMFRRSLQRSHLLRRRRMFRTHQRRHLRPMFRRSLQRNRWLSRCRKFRIRRRVHPRKEHRRNQLIECCRHCIRRIHQRRHHRLKRQRNLEWRKAESPRYTPRERCLKKRWKECKKYELSSFPPNWAVSVSGEHRVLDDFRIRLAGSEVAMSLSSICWLNNV